MRVFIRLSQEKQAIAVTEESLLLTLISLVFTPQAHIQLRIAEAAQQDDQQKKKTDLCREKANRPNGCREWVQRLIDFIPFER